MIGFQSRNRFSGYYNGGSSNSFQLFYPQFPTTQKTPVKNERQSYSQFPTVSQVWLPAPNYETNIFLSHLSSHKSEDPSLQLRLNKITKLELCSQPECVVTIPAIYQSSMAQEMFKVPIFTSSLPSNTRVLAKKNTPAIYTTRFRLSFPISKATSGNSSAMGMGSANGSN